MKLCKGAAGWGLSCALAAGLLAPVTVGAQTAGPWQFQAAVYAYLPSIGGSSKFPVDSGGSSISVGTDQILDALNFAFMGALEANNGQWGVLTDVLYLDVDGSKSRSRDFTVSGISIPAGTSADLKLRLKGTVWTLAGEYRVVTQPEFTLDLLAGTRLFNMKQTLAWAFQGTIGPITGPQRAGSKKIDASAWDAIVGAKGRYEFGQNRAWSLPFYVDVGTGQSDLTWQASVGLAYRFSWGSAYGAWRYLDYKLKSNKAIESIDFNGPMLGVAFRW